MARKRARTSRWSPVATASSRSNKMAPSSVRSRISSATLPEPAGRPPLRVQLRGLHLSACPAPLNDVGQKSGQRATLACTIAPSRCSLPAAQAGRWKPRTSSRQRLQRLPEWKKWGRRTRLTATLRRASLERRRLRLRQGRSPAAKAFPRSIALPHLAVPLPAQGVWRSREGDGGGQPRRSRTRRSLRAPLLRSQRGRRPGSENVGSDTRFARRFRQPTMQP